MDSYFCVYVYFFLSLCVFKLFFSFRLNVAGTFCRYINAGVCWCFGTFVFGFFFAFFQLHERTLCYKSLIQLIFFSASFYSFKPTKCFHNWCALTVVLVEKLLSFSHRKHTLIPTLTHTHLVSHLCIFLSFGLGFKDKHDKNLFYAIWLFRYCDEQTPPSLQSHAFYNRFRKTNGSNLVK